MDAGASESPLGLDAERTLQAVERDEEQRQADWERLTEHTTETFVIVDEFGSTLNLTLVCGRAPRGQRAVRTVSSNAPPNTSLIASLTGAATGGATDAVTFEACIEQVLAPTLWLGQIVVLDTLSAHTGDRVRELIAARGCQV